MVIEARFLRTLPVCLLPIPRHSDEHNVLENSLFAHPLRNLETVKSRQADVQQHQVRWASC